MLVVVVVVVPAMVAAPSRTQFNIGPEKTTTPTRKRRRVVAPRQIIADQSQVSQAESRCQLLSGNDIISCFPTASTVIPQEEWATFVCMSS